MFVDNVIWDQVRAKWSMSLTILALVLGFAQIALYAKN